MSSDEQKVRDRILRKYEDLLEAAFDGELEAVEELLKGPPKLPLEPDPKIFPADTFSPLSEAAAGNAVGVVARLLEKGADPNQRGQFGRTPLYRACFNEHEEVVLPLLEGGADPRKLLPQEYEEVTDDEAEAEAEAAAAAAASDADAEDAPPRDKIKKTVPREWDPEEVPVASAIKAILRTWDIQKTFALLEGREAAASQEKAQTAQIEQGLVSEEKELQNAFEALQSEWQAALKIRESRILEHDNAKCQGNHRAAESLVPLIEEAEQRVDTLRVRKDEAEQKLSHARSKVRQHKVDAAGGLKVNVKIGLTQLPDIVQDAAGEILKTGKCATIIDASENGRSYLKYRNVVVVDQSNPTQMQPVKLAEALLGAVKQGRAFILDLNHAPCHKEALLALKAVHEGLPDMLLRNAFTEAAQYEALITPALLASAPDLEKQNFPPLAAARFRFMFITSNPYPEEALLGATYSIMLQA